jgi:hypothetical protein
MPHDEAKRPAEEGASTTSVRECDKMNEDCFVGSNPTPRTTVPTCDIFEIMLSSISLRAEFSPDLSR